MRRGQIYTLLGDTMAYENESVGLRANPTQALLSARRLAADSTTRAIKVHLEHVQQLILQPDSFG
jgi:hypothetical protein